MSKKTTTITVDSFVLSKAKREIPNLSGFVENCLIEYLNINDDNIVDCIQEELNNIKDARLKIHLLSKNRDNRLESEAFDKEKQFKAWSDVWNKYRNDILDDKLISIASICLNVTEEDLKSMMDDLLMELSANDLVKCDDWCVACELHQKIISE